MAICEPVRSAVAHGLFQCGWASENSIDQDGLRNESRLPQEWLTGRDSHNLLYAFTRGTDCAVDVTFEHIFLRRRQIADLASGR